MNQVTSDETFDAVVSQFGLMLFADRTTALAEMMRVLKNEGTAWRAGFCLPG